MRDEEVAIAILAILVGGIIALWSIYHSKRHAMAVARLEVMKKALEHPSIDERTKQQLVGLLAEQQRLDQRPFLEQFRGSFAGLRRAARATFLGLGWILFLFGGCVLLLHWAGAWPSHYADVMSFSIMAASGLVMMTLPTAVRELTHRDQGAAAEQ